MGSTRTALVSCVQTILGFAKVVWILSVHVESFLSGARNMCRAEICKSPVEKIQCNWKEVRVKKIKQDIRRRSQKGILKCWFAKNNFTLVKDVTWSFFWISPTSRLWENTLISWSLGFSHLHKWIKIPYLPTSWFVGRIRMK